MTRKLMLSVPTCAALWVFGAGTAHAGYPTPTPTTPSCPDGTLEFKIDAPYGEKTYTLPGTEKKVTVKSDGYKFDWKSTEGIDAVIAIAGYDAKEYEYPTEAYKDYNLFVGSYKPKKLSKIKFCYDLNLKVTKTAEAEFTRKYEWDIDKTADPTYVEIDKGETAEVEYTITLTAVPKDFGRSVSGEVKIENQTKFEAKITEVKDLLDGYEIPLDCRHPQYPSQEIDFPFTLGPKQTITCMYDVSVPDNTTQVENKVIVKTSKYSKVGGDTAKAVAKFDTPTEVKDDCVEVTDTLVGGESVDLGMVCVQNLPEPITHTREFEGSFCGERDFTNVAEFETTDTGAKGYDDAVVKIKVNCADGCTRTQGYWKTHSKCGPVAQDPTWCSIGAAKCSKTDFYYSGLEWCKVLWEPVKGNAWFILAYQYIAAELNSFNVDVPTAVESVLASARLFFKNCTPQNWTTTAGCADKSTITEWASLLEKFNSGKLGPEHCE